MKRTVITFVITLVIAVAFIFTAPHIAIMPGKLLPKHNNISCVKCHSSLKDTQNKNCSGCHDEQKIKLYAANYKKEKQESVTALHSQKSTSQCLACHTEHKGTQTLSDIKFMHSLLDDSIEKECLTCHKNSAPANEAHSYKNVNCSTCHISETWKNAKFNHKVIPNSENCISCHSNKTPKDELHIQYAKEKQCSVCHQPKDWKDAIFEHTSLVGNQSCKSCHTKEVPKDDDHPKNFTNSDCKDCHDTHGWEPAVINHNPYFVFDENHQTECKTCHSTTDDYKKYTCYGCHEHEQGKIAKEHVKEGINDYSNCVKCHRTGDKHGSEGKKSEGKSVKEEHKEKSEKKERHHEKDHDDD